MQTIRHTIYGTAQIIRREGDLIVIKYDKTGEESNLKFPDSFLTKPCLFVLDPTLQSEVDTIVEARKEEARILREKKEAERAQAQAQAVVAPVARRSSKKIARVQTTDAIEQCYREYLIASGYSVETPSGKPSVVDAYIRAVKRIMKDEGLTWSSLKMHISSIVPIYDKGGAKEDEGAQQHDTYINALRRFEDFVNNSTP